jgi:hypothetical protein
MFRHGAWVKFWPSLPVFAAPYLDGAHTAPDGLVVGIYQRASAEWPDHIAVVAPDGKNHTVTHWKPPPGGGDPTWIVQNVRFDPLHCAVLVAADIFTDLPEPRRVRRELWPVTS